MVSAAPGTSLGDRVFRAETGDTGLEGFDDWARELVETGYLHNHARMWFASIWIFTLKLPWVLGADFFMRHLIDADPASNTLSWRWVAGLQTRGKTYLARTANIEQHTNGRFRPGDLAPTAPALPSAPHPPVGSMREAATVPPEADILLLLTEEDLTPEQVMTSSTQVKSLATLQTTRLRSPGQIGSVAHNFVTRGLVDAGERASILFDTPCNALAPLTTWNDLSTTATELAELCDKAGVQKIATAYLPIGPTRTVVDRIRPLLLDRGLQVIEVRRPWDTRAWPYATHGFFKFKEKIPSLLSAANVL